MGTISSNICTRRESVGKNSAREEIDVVCNRTCNGSYIGRTHFLRPLDFDFTYIHTIPQLYGALCYGAIDLSRVVGLLGHLVC